MIVLFGFLACAVATYLAIDKQTILQNVALKCVLSILTAAVISSITFCICIVTQLGLTVFNALLVVIPSVYIFIAFKKQNYRPKPWHIERFSSPMLAVILFGLCYFSYQFFDASVRWGEWDAWAIWIQHARFLQSESGAVNLFTNDLAWSHPDYPLLLPSLVAMFWQISDSAFVPAIIAYVVAVLLLLSILTSFLERGYRLFGLLLFLILSTSDVLFPFVASQCADTLVALFIVAAFVLLHHLPERSASAQLFLLGFVVASCGWIKNEGVVFSLIFSIVLAAKHIKRFSWLKWFAIGTLLPLAMIVAFKVWFAPANDLVNTESAYADKLADTTRYRFIFDYMYSYLKDNCALLYYSLACILLLRYRFAFSFGFIVLVLLFAAYFFAYVISPNDLTWHLSTSFSRLVHQIFPALIYLIYYAAAEKFSSVGPNLRFSTVLKV
jgi:hypothetical protein